jgi:hypothetical protein
VFLDLEAEAVGNRILTIFDGFIVELFDLAAVHADDMIVVRTGIEFENRHAVLEAVPADQARGLELRQHTIDSGQANVIVRFEQAFADFLGREVARLRMFKNLENLEPRQRDFEPGIAQVFAFHLASLRFDAAGHSALQV